MEIQKTKVLTQVTQEHLITTEVQHEAEEQAPTEAQVTQDTMAQSIQQQTEYRTTMVNKAAQCGVHYV